MMTRQVVSGVLAVIAILAVSATAAQAGAGGSPSPLTSFFVCDSIGGSDAGQEVDLESPVFGPDRQGVRIGRATLACAFARLFRAGTSTEIEPNPAGSHEQLKCYAMSVSRQTASSPPPRYTFTDELLGVDPDVKGSSTQYICAPASLTR